MLTLARALQEDGHTVSFATRDVAGAETVLAGSGMPFYPAPANFLPRGGSSLHSYPQILLGTAFNREDELCARVRAWRSLFQALGTEVLVVDHAPTALLAARGMDLPCVITGNGFVIPPDVSPLPELRTWEPEDPAVLERSEALALERANAVAARIGAPRLPRLADLYAAAAPALFTFPELDNYRSLRGDAEYWGTLPSPGGAEPQWPDAPGKCIFFYGQPYPSLEAVLTELSRGPHRALVYIPKLAAELRAKLAGPRIAFADGFMDMSQVTRDCDAAVMTNGHGTTAAMLLAGKPVVLLPRQLEMFLIARSVEEHGAGLSAPLLKLEGILGKLERVLTEPAFREKAQALSRAHEGWRPDTPVTKFRALVTRLAGER
jgi:UDP:flavonoid glycosyltransferase YjiC (YdhE family)